MRTLRLATVIALLVAGLALPAVGPAVLARRGPAPATDYAKALLVP